MRAGPNRDYYLKNRKGSKERHDLSNFLAIQLARTPDHIIQIMFPVLAADYAPSLPISKAVMRQYLAEAHLRATPRENEVKAATDWVNGLMAAGELLTKGDALEILFEVALEKVAPLLHDKAWSVEIDPKERFMTSDLPVSKYWSSSKRKSYQGVGVQDATEIRFPLDPGHILVLRPRYPEHRVVVSDARVQTINRDVATHSYRFVISHSDQESALVELSLRDRPAAL